MKLIFRGDAQRRLPDAGPSPLRYLVVLVTATFAVLAVTVVMPSIGHGVRSGFCGRGDTACAQHAIATDDLGVCRVLSHADTVTDDAVVFTDDLGQSGRLTLSRTVDKQAVVHWFVRQDGPLGTDADPVGSDADPAGSDITAVAGGQLTEFASEDAAREYITAAQHLPVRQRLSEIDPTGLANRLATSIDGYAVVHPQPDAFFVEGGNALELGSEARSGVNGDLISGGTTGVAEVKFTNTSRPVSTVYVRLSSAALSGLGLQPSPVRALSPSAGLGIASVSFDWTGRPQLLVIEAAGQLPGRLGPPFGGAGPNLMAGLVEPGPSTDEKPFTGRVSIAVNLDNALTAELAADALHDLGIPLLLDQGSEPIETLKDAPETDSPVERLYQLLDQGTATGTSVTVNTYRHPAGSAARGGVTLGLQGGLTIAGALPDQDYYYAPGQGFVRWQTCG